MSLLSAAASVGLRHYLEKAAPGVCLVVQLVAAHKAIAIFTVIALEEIGVPLPAIHSLH